MINRRNSSFLLIANSVMFILFLAFVVMLIVLPNIPPEPEPTIEEPKQEHHVIYIAVCGVLEGILITTNPIQYADWKTPMTPEMTALEKEAHLTGRFFTFVAGLWVVCPEQADPDLQVVQ